ncbi:hypothetical protein [Tautonia rosea]|uniref:hypothetical protein n=1 Tax=Tautonia rosea TaxID=2728037 RepID=UPI00147349A9|nr:hypothetical protein [Tautonia rosea]
MFVECESADPAVHRLCVRIARRCAFVIQAVLREEERIEATREFYRICREELDKPEPVREV